jgi:glycosyltransferase involved in cell wall biosynthesis
VHDPELLLVLRGLRDLPAVVWDVHEDTASAAVDKSWVPTWGRGGFRSAVGWLERWAERNLHLILAEEAYADRFERPHPVIPNHPVVPEAVVPTGDDRVVYVGRLSRLRGAAELIAVGRALAGEVTVELIGAADADVQASLDAAVAEGSIVWGGYLPNDRALPRVGGALAGLSLLHDEPNYRSSMPTKIYEYLGWGVPAVTTPLPAARAFVEQHEAGIVVPFEDPVAVVGAVHRLRADAQTRRGMAERGRAAVVAEHNWAVTSKRFVELLRGWAV